MPESGEVVLAHIQFTDSFETKQRPALILFEELGNLVVAGITSNTSMKGIPISKKEGALKESVIKTNYIFTITKKAVSKKLFRLNADKRKLVYNELDKRLSSLME